MIPLVSPHGLSAHAGFEQWLPALASLATATISAVLAVLALPSAIGLLMLLGGNCCMLAKFQRSPGGSHSASLSSDAFPLLKDVYADAAAAATSTRDSVRSAVSSVGGSLTSHRTSARLSVQLSDRDTGKAHCVSICCARGGCCISFMAAICLFGMACVW